MNMQTYVNINGAITTADKASISVFDHGFLFGDSVYESFRTCHRKPFLFSRHFHRLERSARGIFLELPWSKEQFRSEIIRTVEAAAHPGESKVRLIVTRGTGDVAADPETCTAPAVVIIVTPFRELSPAIYSEGVEITISSIPRGGMAGELKTGNLLHQVLATREANLRGVHDAILLTVDGYISDGIASNIYMVQGSTLKTPGAEASIVEGTTKVTVLALAGELGMTVVQGLFRPDEIFRSNEMFLTSTFREVVPVVRVDGKSIGTGRPGPTTQRIIDAYRARVRHLLKED
jgi:branched-chain amino acid aminotransferase